MIKKWFTLIATIMLSACVDVPPSEDYLLRLERVLDVEPTKKSNTPLQFPEARNLKISQIDQQISIREFLGLRECKLHLAIAERNSQMGKVAHSSQRLKNDLDILAHGPECLEKIVDQGLREKLQVYLQVKQTMIGERLWHALLAEQEYRQLWRRHSFQTDYPIIISDAALRLNEDIEALTVFADSVLSGEYLSSAQRFDLVEQRLGRLRNGDAGALLNELIRLNEDLSVANDMIKQRLERKLCVNRSPTPNARNFQNVVTRFFIEAVQAHAVNLFRRQQQILPSITALEKRLLPFAQPAFTDWVTQRNSIIKRAEMATKQHALLIQELFNQCGLAAGNSIR